ncbi:MAG: hypothetical protein ACPL06_02695 [Candidatus Anstonellales archaeon]
MPKTEKECELYRLIVMRYKELIEKSEDKTITEIRAMVSPYNDFVQKKKEELLSSLPSYNPEKDFFSAMQKAIEYIKSIENIEMPIKFWLGFEELDRLKAGDVYNQALLLASLFRALDGKDVLVYSTEKGNFYVGFSWQGLRYVVNPANGAMFIGEDIAKLFQEDKPMYSFSDLAFESFD